MSPIAQAATPGVCRTTTLFVATTGTRAAGTGAPHNPFRTITAAIADARKIRASCAAAITIDVAPGTYIARSVRDDTTESLPIVIDIPKITLRGSTWLQTDRRHIPTGRARHPSRLAIDPTAAPPVGLLFVAPGGNDVTVEGFVLDTSGPPPAGHVEAVGIGLDSVKGFVVRGNIVRGNGSGEFGGDGVSTRGASGRVDGNYVTANYLGAGLTAGPKTAPARLVVTNNRFVGNGEGGLGFGGTGDNAYPFTPRAQSTSLATFDHLIATASNNDLARNAGAGLYIGNQTRQTAATSSNITVTAIANTIEENAFGVIVHAQLTYRTLLGVPIPLLYTGQTLLDFKHNVISRDRQAPALVTFTHSIAALDPQQLLVPKSIFFTFKYLQHSTFTIRDTGEFAHAWIDDPVRDPVDCRRLSNRLLIDGVNLRPPTRSPQLGPPLRVAC